MRGQPGPADELARLGLKDWTRVRFTSLSDLSCTLAVLRVAVDSGQVLQKLRVFLLSSQLLCGLCSFPGAQQAFCSVQPLRWGAPAFGRPRSRCDRAASCWSQDELRAHRRRHPDSKRRLIMLCDNSSFSIPVAKAPAASALPTATAGARAERHPASCAPCRLLAPPSARPVSCG